MNVNGCLAYAFYGIYAAPSISGPIFAPRSRFTNLLGNTKIKFRFVLSFRSLPLYPPVTFTASHIIIPITYYYTYTPSYSNRIIVNI